ncbi:MAG: cyclase family protein [Firmicutes bacterium]|nr:cyclase family protein [Bacillota bacterium]
MTIIDLTLPLSQDLPTWPGDPPVELRTYAGPEYRIGTITMGTHSGTHMDAPCHFIQGGASLDMVDLNRCVGRAAVLPLGKLEPGARITRETLLPYQDALQSGGMVLLQTGWSRRIKEDYFTAFPSIEPDCAQWLIDQGISLLGVEQPSLHVQLDTLVHRMFLSAGIIIVEGLTNLDLVPNGGLVAILPLRLMEADGAPVRAVCILED